MTLSFKGRMAAQPTWHPDEQGLVFALQSLPEKKNFDLYSLEIESKCLKDLPMRKQILIGLILTPPDRNYYSLVLNRERSKFTR